jgi:hypothetical protein
VCGGGGVGGWHEGGALYEACRASGSMLRLWWAWMLLTAAAWLQLCRWVTSSQLGVCSGLYPFPTCRKGVTIARQQGVALLLFLLLRAALLSTQQTALAVPSHLVHDSASP